MPIEITEEEIRAFYNVLQMAEDGEYYNGGQDSPDIFSTYLLFRKLTGITEPDILSKLKGNG
jgi:hypothetical protein